MNNGETCKLGPDNSSLLKAELPEGHVSRPRCRACPSTGRCTEAWLGGVCPSVKAPEADSCPVFYELCHMEQVTYHLRALDLHL